MKWWQKLLDWLPRSTSGERMSERADEIQEADRRLEEIGRDGEKVASLEARMQQILRENNLAPAIVKALRVR